MIPDRGKLRLSAAARQDIRDTVEYYKSVREGLDRQFLEQLVFRLDAVVNLPETFQVIYKDVRRACLRQFPYGIFYRCGDDFIRVIAVVNFRRHPRIWKRRT